MPDRTMFLWDEPGFAGGWSPPAPAGLERRIGSPRESWSVSDLVGFCRRHDVRLLSLLHVGGDGRLKTLDFVVRSESHLARVLDGGERADGSSLFGAHGIEPRASDVVLVPRLETAFLDPFASSATLAVLCGHATRDGEPLAVSPDTIVRRADARLAKSGVRLWALGEIEYFLGRRFESSDARGRSERGYHASAPDVFGEPLRRRALLCLADLGIPVKYGHSEVGGIEPDESDRLLWEQHEIELDLLPCPRAADAVILARWVLGRLADREGFRLSTAPVVRASHAGNGLHLHLAPREGGVDLESGAWDEGLSTPGRWLLGGLLETGGGLMAFGNRHERSFERLTAGRETPKRLTWGTYDRVALVRLPAVPRAADGERVAPATIEYRLPDGSAHPHLVLAGVMQAMRDAKGRDDLDERIRGARAGADDENGRARLLPRSFPEVAQALSRIRPILEAGGVFPPALIDAVLAPLLSRRPPP